MHAPLALSLCPLAVAVVLGACADQPAPTAPSTTPSFLSTHRTYTFSLSCTNAGASTVAQVTLSPGNVTSSLGCGNAAANQTLSSFDYLITVTDGNDTPVAQCQNTRPIRGPRSITCQNAAGTSSATLTLN